MPVSQIGSEFRPHPARARLLLCAASAATAKKAICGVKCLDQAHTLREGRKMARDKTRNRTCAERGSVDLEDIMEFGLSPFRSSSSESLCDRREDSKCRSEVNPTH